MVEVVTRKCCHCGELFEPDFRNRRRQQSCRLDACRRASKQARQRRWVSKPATFVALNTSSEFVSGGHSIRGTGGGVGGRFRYKTH